MSVTEFTRKYVRNRADYLCGYCHSPEKIIASRFTLDHSPSLNHSNHSSDTVAQQLNKAYFNLSIHSRA